MGAWQFGLSFRITPYFSFDTEIWNSKTGNFEVDDRESDGEFLAAGIHARMLLGLAKKNK